MSARDHRVRARKHMMSERLCGKMMAPSYGSKGGGGTAARRRQGKGVSLPPRNENSCQAESLLSAYWAVMNMYYCCWASFWQSGLLMPLKHAKISDEPLFLD